MPREFFENEGSLVATGLVIRLIDCPMQCPYCSSPLSETSLECSSCHLTLDGVKSLLGIPPRLIHGLTDSRRLLNTSGRNRITAMLKNLEWRYPQVKVHVVMHDFPVDHPLSLYAFWLFNCSGLSSEKMRGGGNRSIMILLDPIRRELVMTTGYGLEPLLSEVEQERILDLAVDKLAEKDWEKGLREILAGVDQMLESVANGLATTLAVSPYPQDRYRGEY